MLVLSKTGTNKTDVCVVFCTLSLSLAIGRQGKKIQVCAIIICIDETEATVVSHSSWYVGLGVRCTGTWPRPPNAVHLKQVTDDRYICSSRISIDGHLTNVTNWSFNLSFLHARTRTTLDTIAIDREIYRNSIEIQRDGSTYLRN